MRHIWTAAVLTLVFGSEVIALVSFGLWGWDQAPGWLWVWLLPLLGASVWGAFASPKAAYGGPRVRPVVKILVFAAAYLALRETAGDGWAIAFLVGAAVVNALAALPAVRESPLATRPPADR